MTNTETVNATSMPINSAINSEEEKLNKIIVYDNVSNRAVFKER